MHKKTFVLASVLGLFLAVIPVLAAKPADKPNPSADLPEQAGIYDVPGHANWKLRVIVHPAKNNSNPINSSSLGSSLVCNLADPDSTSTTGKLGWHLPASWTYNLNPNNAPSSIGNSNAATIAANAFKQWTDAALGAVTIIRGSDTNATRQALDGNNIIAWGRTMGSALAVTYTWYDSTTGVVQEVDTIMNVKFPWKWSDPATWSSNPGYASGTCAYTNVYDAQDIMTHELGHWMGLNDFYTSAYTNNTMFGYGATGETKKDTLTKGDKNGVAALYR